MSNVVIILHFPLLPSSHSQSTPRQFLVRDKVWMLVRLQKDDAKDQELRLNNFFIMYLPNKRVLRSQEVPFMKSSMDT